MTRKDFIKLSAMGIFSLKTGIEGLGKAKSSLEYSESNMPVLFMGHGSPMNAIEENEFTKSWKETGNKIKPAAILCISAHWLTRGTYVATTSKPETIYDFYGFPPEMYKVSYDCPGSPQFADEVLKNVQQAEVKEDNKWGLDHGSWSILMKMYPNADIPVFQMSIDYTKSLQFHYNLARELSFLRKKGVLILGSGNIVHNLRMAKFSADPVPYDWALEFDDLSKKLILDRNHQDLIQYKKFGKAAELSIPTEDHYIPLIYALGLQEKSDEISFPVEGMAFGSGSMRSVFIG